MPSSSEPTPAPLQFDVGWGLTAGIVPVHVIDVDWPALSGTATLWVGGVAAPPCKAPTATAAAAAAPRAIVARTSVRPRNPPGMRIDPPTPEGLISPFHHLVPPDGNGKR